MERLQRRSDDIAETRSGLFAVAFKRHLSETSDLYSFSFHVKPAEPPITIRWRKEDGIAVIDQHVAIILLNRGYARNITDEELLRWNHMIDQLHPDALSPAPVSIPPAPQPVPEVAQENAQDATEQAKEAVQQAAAPQVASGTQNAPTGGSEGEEKPEEEKTQEEQEATGDNDHSQEDASSSEGTSEEENSTEETDGETGDGSSEEETVDEADEKPAKKTRAKKGLL
jgi:type IV secretory pathway VirB10-like protein